MLKCPAIAQVERDTIGQRDARFDRVARSLGLEVCGCTTVDRNLQKSTRSRILVISYGPFEQTIATALF